jgi:hypothetical protein
MNKLGANEFVSFMKTNKQKINTKGDMSLPELVEFANNNGYKCSVTDLSTAMWKMN